MYKFLNIFQKHYDKFVSVTNNIFVLYVVDIFYFSVGTYDCFTLDTYD